MGFGLEAVALSRALGYSGFQGSLGFGFGTICQGFLKSSTLEL